MATRTEILGLVKPGLEDDADIRVINANMDILDKQIGEVNGVQKYKASWFDSVADMKAEQSLTEGAYVCTSGYYASNDGGGASYLIRARADSDTVDNGSLHELSNGLVAEMIIENGTVNIKQFGAKEQTDISDIISKITLKSAINKILIAFGTYFVDNTININDYVAIIGAGRTKTTLVVNADIGIQSSTSYIAPLKIEGIKIIGSSSNTFLCASRDKWGSGFEIRDFYLIGFKKFYIAKSAYNSIVENGVVASNAIGEYTTFDGSITEQNFCNQNTVKDVYWSGTQDSEGYIFSLHNVRSLNICGCTLEHRKYLFVTDDAASIDNISVQQCWMEKIDYVCETKSLLNKIKFINNRTVFMLNYTSEDIMAILPDAINTYIISNLEHNDGQMYQTLFNSSEKQQIFTKGIKTNKGYYTLIDINTKNINTFIPINSIRETITNSNEYSKSIDAVLKYESLSAIIDVYCYIAFSDTSASMYKGELLHRYTNADDVFSWIKIKNSTWGDASDDSTTFTVESGVYKITTNKAVAKMIVITNFKILGERIL